MNDWSLASEYFAFILLAVIALFFYNVRAAYGFRTRRKVYWASLGFSAVSILLNIVTVNVINHIEDYSVTIAMTLNTLYFFVSWVMISVMIYYLFLRVLEFVYDKRYIRRVRALLPAILVLYTLLLIYNIPSGIIFGFDADGNYCRGPLNAIGFLMPISEVLLLCVCCIYHGKHVGKATKRVLFVAAPIAVLLMAYQAVYPDQLLNGAISALVNLIIFISYRGGRAEQDYLTGMDNFRCFMNELNYRTAGRQSYQIILINLRCLPKVTHAYGQRGGNSLIFQLGSALQRLAAYDGQAFRCGNEEFALLFSDSDDLCCTERLAMVQDIMKKRWKLGKYETVLSYSIIDFRYSGQHWNIEDVSGYLTDAMHIASNDDLELMRFDERLVYRHQRRNYLLQTMHTALEKGLFQVWYQPVYYHSSDKFESAEALLRMFDEDGTCISPNEFIPIAEETGMIDDLTELVLENTCRLLSSGTLPDLKAVSVNIPVRQVIEDGLKERFMGILEKYNVEPCQIRLEITERDFVESGSAAAKAMKELQDAGYRFMLDDFGIGYSNLSRVLAMPLDSIKLDRSLVLLFEENERQLSIMRDYFIPLFRQLGQNIIAEGVETEQMATLVLGCGVDRIQGFYYSKPMPESMLKGWYEHHAAVSANGVIQ